MATNKNDKYYTPEWLVARTIITAIRLIGYDNITDIVEPSAGNGAFIEALKSHFPDIPHHYFDLFPEHPEIKQANYLDIRLGYKKGRLTIGNPPFGHSNVKFKAFLRKAARNSDYIAFISPFNQYDKNYYFKEGKLIYSELLDDVEFLGGENGHPQIVATCLNVYEVKDRIEDIWDNEQINKDVRINGTIKDEQTDAEFHLRRWGNSRWGTGALDQERKYALHISIKVLNPLVYDKVKEFAHSFYETYFKELNGSSHGIPVLTTEFVKDKLKDYLYKNNKEIKLQEIKIKREKYPVKLF
jgi:hypothetical protein